VTAEQLISFSRGAPSLDIIDVDGLKAAAGRAFDADPAGVTAYGTSVGYPPLRQWIAERHGVPVDHVLVTNGSMQADAFLFDLLARRGDNVVTELPSYDRTLLGLQQRGANVHQVPVEPDGINIDGLRALLASGVRPSLAHIIPNFQNPAGVTLSLEKRHALLDLSAEYEFTIFEDDPYADIRFGGDPLPSMLSMNTSDLVVHASSFTKTVCPGVRVGYLVGPPEKIATIATRATNLYISPSMVAQAIVYQFCVSGAFERSIKTVCAALGERVQVLADSLRTHLPDATFIQPAGGYFMWVELGDDVDAARVFTEAAERGVAVVKGSDFVIGGGEHALRLAYSAVTVDQIDEGIRRLAAAVDAARQRP
jgi:2-aminoadipate transaminase